ncbi:hypothetical protein WJX82_001314 [Trebouxia sp. C0006]
MLTSAPQPTWAQTVHGPNPYFAPYLQAGELPDGAVVPLFQEVWRIVGNDLNTTNFTAKVDQVSETIFAAYSYQGKATGSKVSEAATTYVDGERVSPEQLAGNATSDRLYLNYNSVDVSLDVTINNKAWYPDLGSVASTNHNRLANILTGEGFTVVAWLASSYVLYHEGRQVLARMPVPMYRSYLVDLKVKGANLVPMTLQKQNLVIAVLADLLAFAAVWQIRCIAVHQNSLLAGQDISSAVISFVAQQDADALFVGQALMSIINDTLGMPLFDTRMAALQLPMSATIHSITEYPGESITDQIDSVRPHHQFPVWQIVLIVSAASLGIVAMVLTAVVWRKKQQKHHLGGSGLVSQASVELQNFCFEIQVCLRPDGQAWVLGAGTYGTVYKARRGSQDVAVKTLNTQVLCPSGTSSHDWRSIQKELRLHERLSRNRNLVQFWGHCVKHGCIYLVLELMEGGDLRQALQSSEGKQQLHWYKTGSVVALDIIKGLHFLHSHCVLHRDLKSGNVLLSKEFDVAKVCDIGLSHIMGNTSLSPPAAQATFAYAAPEMLLNLRCNEKADIFSYGVVLWEIITQEPPRRGHLRDLKVPQECPQEVADLVDACLDQCADSRPTADDIIRVVEQSAQLNSSVEG